MLVFRWLKAPCVGFIAGVVGVGQDITKIKQAMDQSAHVASDLTRLIDTANAPIFGIDTGGNVTEWNRRAADITGYRKDDTIGQLASVIQTRLQRCQIT